MSKQEKNNEMSQEEENEAKLRLQISNFGISGFETIGSEEPPIPLRCLIPCSPPLGPLIRCLPPLEIHPKLTLNPSGENISKN